MVNKYRFILFFLTFSLGNDFYDNSWALIIGINKYENVRPLDYAVKDAKAIKSLLIETCYFPE